jgi:hypothetical protein
MPHYKDGTPAAIGDIVKGKQYDSGPEVRGVVVGISPSSDTCNMRIGKIDVYAPTRQTEAGPVLEPSADHTVTIAPHPWTVSCKDFVKLDAKTPEPAPAI